jgi:glycosyltransferase involved in cell wall biosynthesis
MSIASGGESLPAVSVIVPAYRTTEYICETLDSVLAQTFRDFEIIVVNDGCPDTINLERVLAPYRSEITYLKLEHAGLAAARNAGIQAARASLIALLDSDDVWEADYLGFQVGMMRADPTTDVLYSNAVFFGDTPHAGLTYMDLFPSEGEVTVASVLDRRCCIYGCPIGRRETFLRAGLYNPGVRGAEDLDLWLRILNQGGKIAYHRKALTRYRGRAGSITRDELSSSQQLISMLTEARRTLNLGDSDRCCLDDAIARQTASLHRAIGRKAFFEGDVQTAYSNLAEANRYFHSVKGTLVLLLMRCAPRFLRWLADRRSQRGL